MKVTKICTKCGEEKPATLEYFYKDKTGKDGIQSQCKECKKSYSSKWRENNPEKKREANKRWRENNPEYRKRWRENNPEYCKRWDENNHEKVRETTKRWRENNPEKKREANKKWRENNPEKVRESVKRWYENNHEKVRAISKRHRDKLADSYVITRVAAQFNIPRSEISNEITEAKRRQLKYYRQLRTLKKQQK